MNKLKIPKGTVITCPTEKDAEELMKVFDKLGLKWASGDSYIKSNYYWDDFKENTIYDVFSGTYGNIEWSNYPNKITAQEFIKLHTMEKRNVTLTLDKAKEFYNSGNTALKEIALQAFTEEELTEKPWQKIKTFWEAVDALGLSSVKVLDDLRELKKMANGKHVVALYKLDIIRKALNKGQKMGFTEGTLYYPYNPFVTEDSNYFRSELGSGNMIEVAKFRADGVTYRLLGNKALCKDGGLSGFSSTLGAAHSYDGIGFLGCATKRIAEHMSRYFAEEIFEAKYTDFVDFE